MKKDKRLLMEAMTEALERLREEPRTVQYLPPEPALPPVDDEERPSLLKRIAGAISRSLIFNMLRVLIVAAALVFAVTLVLPQTIYVSAGLDDVQQVQIDRCRIETAVFSGKGKICISQFDSVQLTPRHGGFSVGEEEYDDEHVLVLHPASEDSKCIISGGSGAAYTVAAQPVTDGRPHSLQTEGGAVLTNAFERLDFSGCERLTLCTDALLEVRCGDKVVKTYGQESGQLVYLTDCDGMVLNAAAGKMRLDRYDEAKVYCGSVHQATAAGEGQLHYSGWGEMTSMEVLRQPLQVSSAAGALSVLVTNSADSCNAKVTGMVEQAAVMGVSLMPTFVGWLLEQPLLLAAGLLVCAGCILVCKKRREE